MDRAIITIRDMQYVTGRANVICDRYGPREYATGRAIEICDTQMR